jgi:hypothetical protein
MIAIVPASNDAQYCHVDHSVLQLVAERASVFYVGSEFGANQQINSFNAYGASNLEGDARPSSAPRLPRGHSVLYRVTARNATRTKIASVTMKPIDD